MPPISWTSIVPLPQGTFGRLADGCERLGQELVEVLTREETPPELHGLVSELIVVELLELRLQVVDLAGRYGRSRFSSRSFESPISFLISLNISVDTSVRPGLDPGVEQAPSDPATGEGAFP